MDETQATVETGSSYFSISSSVMRLMETNTPSVKAKFIKAANTTTQPHIPSGFSAMLESAGDGMELICCQGALPVLSLALYIVFLIQTR